MWMSLRYKRAHLRYVAQGYSRHHCSHLVIYPHRVCLHPSRLDTLCIKKQCFSTCMPCHGSSPTLAEWKSKMKATSPLAECLAKEAPWLNPISTSNKVGSPRRVNIVSEPLVDDVLKYFGDDLVARHKGCDLLDLNPGVGLWSSKLHDILQPRSHILMEPDQVYQSYLSSLTQRPGVTLIPQSGLIWSVLENTLNPTMLPHQVVQPVGYNTTRTRNDSLLVSCNLGLWPKMELGSHKSAVGLILYQLISAIHSGSLFNKYGLVRMLLWIPSLDKHSINPHAVHLRYRSAFQAELNTEYINELVAGPELGPRSVYLASLGFKNTIERMRKAGIEYPEHRKHELRQLIEKVGFDELVSRLERPDAADLGDKPWHAQVARFEEEMLHIGGDDEVKQRSTLGQRLTFTIQTLCLSRQADLKWKLVEDAYLRNDPAAPLLEQETSQWFKSKFTFMRANHYAVHRENYRSIAEPRAFKLRWDNRAVDPLIASAEEFFPNANLALLDIQPKNANPILYTRGPGTNRIGDYAECLIRLIFHRTRNLHTIMRSACFGAENVLEKVESLRDPHRCGSPLTEITDMTNHSITEEQFYELVDAFHKWPFRPSYAEFISRLGGDESSDLFSKKEDVSYTKGLSTITSTLDPDVVSKGKNKNKLIGVMGAFGGTNNPQQNKKKKSIESTTNNPQQNKKKESIESTTSNPQQNKKKKSKECTTNNEGKSIKSKKKKAK